MRSIKRFEQRMTDWAVRWDEPVKLGKRSMKVSKLLKHNSNFMNKIGGRSNTAHPSTTNAKCNFQFILFLSLALYGSYGRV